MIQFFRHIRKKLLSENKITKYLAYAFGEIILVVIGILIALGINNHNKYNQDRIVESEILAEIKNNLKLDLIDIESNVIYFNNRYISCNVIYDAVKNNHTYHDSLGYFFSNIHSHPHLSIKTNGYKQLLSKGIEIIENQALRNAITNLYEDDYPYQLLYEKEQLNIRDNIFTPVFYEYMGTENLPIELFPKSLVKANRIESLINGGYFKNVRNFDQLKFDEKFLAQIKRIETWSLILSQGQETSGKKVKKIITQIEKELQSTNDSNF